MANAGRDLECHLALSASALALPTGACLPFEILELGAGQEVLFQVLLQLQAAHVRIDKSLVDEVIGLLLGQLIVHLRLDFGVDGLGPVGGLRQSGLEIPVSGSGEKPTPQFGRGRCTSDDVLISRGHFVKMSRGIFAINSVDLAKKEVNEGLDILSPKTSGAEGQMVNGVNKHHVYR